MEQTIAIINMIISMAGQMGVDPNLAVSIAMTESKLNPKAVGSIGEIGLFQVRPEYTPGYSRKQLFNVKTNIRVGLSKLKEAMYGCNTRSNYVGFSWVVCYNVGVAGAKRIKRPQEFAYYKKVMKVYKAIKPENNAVYTAGAF